MKYQTLATLTIALGVTLSTTVAQAANFTALPTLTDPQFEQIKTDGDFEEDWVAEGRIGGPSTFEQGIINWTTNTTNTTPINANFAWPNGTVDFSVTYNAASGGTLTYKLGTQTISAINLTEASRFPNGINTLYLRTRSDNRGDSAKLNSLQITDTSGTYSYNGDVLSNNSDTIDYLLVDEIKGDFTLTGNATLSWLTGQLPTNSRLAFQVKGGYSDAVPEPLTILGSLTALGFGGFFKKKLSKK